MAVGRPTKYRKEFCQMVKDGLAEGLSKEACAGIIGITKETLYQWEKKYPKFSDSIKQGEMLSLLFWERLGAQGAAGLVDNFNSSAWIFNMKNRAHWRDKQPDEIQEEKQPIQINIVKAEDAN